MKAERKVYIGENGNQCCAKITIAYLKTILPKELVEKVIEDFSLDLAHKIASHFNELEKTSS